MARAAKEELSLCAVIRTSTVHHEAPLVCRNGTKTVPDQACSTTLSRRIDWHFSPCSISRTRLHLLHAKVASSEPSRYVVRPGSGSPPPSGLAAPAPACTSSGPTTTPPALPRNAPQAMARADHARPRRPIGRRSCSSPIRSATARAPGSASSPKCSRATPEAAEDLRRSSCGRRFRRRLGTDRPLADRDGASRTSPCCATTMARRRAVRRGDLRPDAALRRARRAGVQRRHHRSARATPATTPAAPRCVALLSRGQADRRGTNVFGCPLFAAR